MHKFLKWFVAVCFLIASVTVANAQSILPTKGVVRVKLQKEVATKVGKMQRKAANGAEYLKNPSNTITLIRSEV